jgi:hypothetical protein
MGGQTPFTGRLEGSDPMSRSTARGLTLAPACALLVVTIAMRVTPAQNQTMTPDEHFKYASVGIEDVEGIPYWIWQAMPRVCASKLPPGGAGYSSFGWVWEPGRELPVGLAKKRLFGGDRIAINCASCHTSVVRTAPQAPRTLIPGGPSNLLSPQAYAQFLEACAGSPEFTADGVLSAIEQAGGRLSWTERLTHRLVLIPNVRRGLARRREANAWMRQRPAWGPGRIDPFNPAKFIMLGLPIDDTIGNSDMPPIWNMQLREGMSLHWDGLTDSVHESVLSSALGDGATPKSIDLESLKRVEDWLLRTPPARYPYPIDRALADRGRPIYEAACASCHARGGTRTGTVIPLEEIGTDRHRLDMWTQQAADTYNRFADDYPWDFKAFRKTNGYVAVPLDGVWLRAPYLHNGSVPYLPDLFEPIERRPRTFYRGYDLYDPTRVGFVAEGAEVARQGFRVETSVPGNSNAGHLYGIDLPADQKRALVEFLKTL